MIKAEYVLVELHREICEMHSEAWCMASRVLRVGYYWPTLEQDAQSFIQKCSECQKFVALHIFPFEELHQILSSWPFTTWGMDILGPFLLAKGQVKFLIVSIDCFTKWVEVEPLVTITTQQVSKFCWKNAICKHDLPHCLVTDNDHQFIDGDFERFL